MGYREFVDDAGLVWRVWDVKPEPRYAASADPQATSNMTPDGPRHVAAGWGNGWLAFQSDAATRRLRPIPKRWEITGEYSLRQYLRDATTVKPRELS